MYRMLNFFSGCCVPGSFCNTVSFLENFGSILTQIRPGHRPENSFFEYVSRLFFWLDRTGINFEDYIKVSNDIFAINPGPI